jgi:hypothetical protein
MRRLMSLTVSNLKESNVIKIIQLTSDVLNPHPDRRSKSWENAPQALAGERFIDNGSSLSNSAERYGWLYLTQEFAKLILANSVEVEPESVRELCVTHRCDYGGEEVLRILLKLGRISAADFAAVANVPEGF